MAAYLFLTEFFSFNCIAGVDTLTVIEGLEMLHLYLCCARYLSKSLGIWSHDLCRSEGLGISPAQWSSTYEIYIEGINRGL